MSEFDYQWGNLDGKQNHYNRKRIKELLKFTDKNRKWFIGKNCLDAGCGNGRYTYAMKQLNASNVTSIDLSQEAINKCKKVNPKAFAYNLMNLKPNPIYDFILSFGVIHHNKDPKNILEILYSQLVKGGMLHIMVYHEDTQKIYSEGRKIWPKLSTPEKINYCKLMISKHHGNIRGWWDALNPKYNWGFTEDKIKNWFQDIGLTNIRIITKYNINIQAMKVLKS